MSRNPDGSVLALSSATDEAMEGFKWHQPPPQQPHETTTATALVSLTPVVPVSQTSRGGGPHSSQQPQNNNQDVINLQYMELEEFLLENAVAVTVPEHKAYQQLHDDPHTASQQQQHHSHPHQQPHPVSLEQRPPGYPGSSLANNVLQIMSSAPSEVKREQDNVGEDEVDPLLHSHRGNSGSSNHPMTPPDHQNDVIMKVGRSIGRTMSGPAGNLLQTTTEHVTGTSTILTPSTRRTNSLCEPNMPQPHHPSNILPHHPDHHSLPHPHAHHHIHGHNSPPAANGVLAINTSPSRNDGSEAGMDNCMALSPSSSASSTSSHSSDGGSGSSGHAAPRVTRGAAAGRNGNRVALAMQASPRGSSGSSSRRLRKEPVPEASKDDKYWKRRAKNNAAAKRSRDLRREKENSILTRVQFLEGQNQIAHQALVDLKQENADLKERLARYEAV